MKIIFILIALLFNVVFAGQDEWGAVRVDTFYSKVNGESVITRISPDFINRGGEWSLGDKLTVNIDKLVEAANAALKTKYSKNWTYEHLSLESYGMAKKKWIIVLTFHSLDNSIASVVCNFKGEIWPYGKVYDEFEK